MGAGRITDFTKPGGGNDKPFQRVEQHRVSGGVQVLDSRHGGQQEPIEFRVHEETIVEGHGKVRLKKNGSPDLRFRNAPTQKEWDKIKRLEDK